jgi:Uma2 family endonuclease
MVAIQNQQWTPETYLAFERASAEKHEFIDGNVYAMTGASEAHNLINVNITIALGIQFRGRPCKLYANDMRVRITNGNYVYPDIAIVCGEAQLEDDQLDTLLNPTVIIEVLSPSTEQYDRGKKFERYRNVESLQEYLLVWQEGAHIERYVRQEVGWLLTEAKGLDARLELSSIGCTLALAEVYDKVTFDEEQP